MRKEPTARSFTGHLLGVSDLSEHCEVGHRVCLPVFNAVPRRR